MMSSRKSKRLNDLKKDSSHNHELQKRIEKKRLDNLERDNYQDDPNADTLPRHDFRFEGIKSVGEKRYRAKKSAIAEYFKTRFKKTFDQLVHEDLKEHPDEPNYTTACAPAPLKPRRKFCEVCGFPSKYNCTACNVKYCSINCLEIHKETRCLKFVA